MPHSADVAWEDHWKDVFLCERVVLAIPGAAWVRITDGDEEFAYNGRLLSADTSMRTQYLHRRFPRAAIARIAPFLIHGTNSVPMLALRSRLSDSDWHAVESDLRTWGTLEYVTDESVYEQLTIIGSPWPRVIREVVRAAAKIGVEGLLEAESRSVGERLFLEAVRAFVTEAQADSETAAYDPLATPGGITESGLSGLPRVSGVLKDVFKEMGLRSEQLRDATEYKDR